MGEDVKPAFGLLKDFSRSSVQLIWLRLICGRGQPLWQRNFREAAMYVQPKGKLHVTLFFIYLGQSFCLIFPGSVLATPSAEIAFRWD
ncbi:hypothetical protein AVEN_112229-1 [Araneus ventricosus]|uniref:Uncharacterized protein n=1 Tax=Araneus ventricosus TaxID=182803 RepID=A0A4Y2K1U7_ARAVE|nr:hypothetical protein AVEN_112229-1 [Araneus ventricosus]